MPFSFFLSEDTVTLTETAAERVDGNSFLFFHCSIVSTARFVVGTYIQGSAKEWALDCVNPAS